MGRKTKDKAYRINAADLPTMKKCCSTCFFHPINGNAEGRASVLSRTLMQASLFCHKDQMAGRPPTALCHGAREVTVQALFAMGLLPEATDESFRAESKRRLGR